jgi:hypothetical protein
MHVCITITITDAHSVRNNHT